MSRSFVDVALGVLGLVVAVTFGIIPIVVAYDLNERGSDSPKALKAYYFPSFDPLSDVRRAKGELSLSLKSGAAEIPNLRIRQTWLQNTGKAPILPGDMIEPLSVSTQAPWRIVTVVTRTPKGPNGVQLSWTRKSATEFTSAPALMNPGDVVAANVYLTKDASVGGDSVTQPDEKVGKPEPDVPIEWQARIANMRGIDVDPDIDTDDYMRALGPIQVSLYGIGVPVLVVTFLSLTAMYSLMFMKLGWLKSKNIKISLLLLSLTALSLVGAEAATTYLFGMKPFDSNPVNHLINAPLIFMNIAAIAYLWWRSFRRQGGENIRPEAQ